VINRAERGKAIPDPENDGAPAERLKYTYVSPFHCFSSLFLCFSLAGRANDSMTPMSPCADNSVNGKQSDFFTLISDPHEPGGFGFFRNFSNFWKKCATLGSDFRRYQYEEDSVPPETR
jgi:hypothetical protein